MKQGIIVVLLGITAAFLGVSQAQASCHAEVICQVTVISCDGQSTCNSGPDWVQCDGGETIYCPVCQAQTTCCDGRFIYCNGYSTCDQVPGRYVKCDGQIQGICPRCQTFSANPAAPRTPDGWVLGGGALPAFLQGSGCS